MRFLSFTGVGVFDSEDKQFKTTQIENSNPAKEEQ